MRNKETPGGIKDVHHPEPSKKSHYLTGKKIQGADLVIHRVYSSPANVTLSLAVSRDATFPYFFFFFFRISYFFIANEMQMHILSLLFDNVRSIVSLKSIRMKKNYSGFQIPM